jgi:hypothetical protein
MLHPRYDGLTHAYLLGLIGLSLAGYASYRFREAV